MSDDISFQTWICPKCSDDHRQGGQCSPKNDKPFSPSPDDRSYLAVKYRELERRLAFSESMIKRALKSWGDYRPKPQSSAAKIIEEMEAFIADLERGAE
jgi:hypothetical protein